MEKITDNIIHICFSECAGASLRHIVKKKKLIEGRKVIEFPDDISQGIIGNEINIDQRIEWWNNINKEDEKIHSNQSECLIDGYKKFYKKVSKIKESDIIYLWYGQSSEEFCGMMYTLELLKDKGVEIYLINVSDKIQEIANGNVFTYRSVSEVVPEKLKSFLKLKKKIEPKEYEELLNQWNLLKKDNSLLRVLKDGKVKSVDENYFDIHILKFTPKEFRKSARTVGSAIGYSETKIYDDYIFWRIQELVKLGMLEFKGKFGIMREMEIKITQKGLELMSTDSEAISYWENVEIELQKERDLVNESKKQGRMEEKIRIAISLTDVLDMEIIAEKTGLTVMQIKNLKS